MVDNQNKTIVITGVSRGLGRALTARFISMGHTVLGCCRNQNAVDQLKKEHGAPHDFYRVDVASDDEVKSWASLMMSQHGSPDLLINNAALINGRAELWEIEAEEFNSLIDVNIKGVANTIRHFGASMVKARRGVIVNFSSGKGRGVSPEMAPYCATKWAIEGMTKALAEELPTTMAAVPLNPGIINTEMLASSFGESASNYQSAEDWAGKAAPFILEIGPDENGQSLSVS
ncbi:SDR family oxidoreductase [Verrucomicrobia bacterium]|nr:SDR family oxidoreductase [Verrucomicrobiota bacterium]